MDSNLKRELILENFENPVNKGLKNDPTYIKEKMNTIKERDEIWEKKYINV